MWLNVQRASKSRRVASHDYVGFCFETFNKRWFITCTGTSLGWPLSLIHFTHLLEVPTSRFIIFNYRCLVAKSEGDLLALTAITASETVEVGPHDCHRHQVRVHQALDLEMLVARLVLPVDGAVNHPDVMYLMRMKTFPPTTRKNMTPQLKSKLYFIDSILVLDYWDYP
jgi:hypothetical protein